MGKLRVAMCYDKGIQESFSVATCYDMGIWESFSVTLCRVSRSDIALRCVSHCDIGSCVSE